MGDLIPILSEVFDQKIHFDNTLYGIRVNPFDLNSTTQEMLYWIDGVAKANELQVLLEGDRIFVKGKDFARSSTIVAGNLSSDFIDGVKNMGWDVLPIAGRYIVEYPSIHESLVKEILSIERIVSTFQVNVSVWDSSFAKESGIKVEDFTTFVLGQFDALQASDQSLIVTMPSLALKKTDQTLIMERNISAELSGTFGETMTQKISTQRNFVTTSTDTLGQRVSQEIQSFESGLTLNLLSYPLSTKMLKPTVFLKFDLEISQDVSSESDVLPVIQRRVVSSTGRLGLNTVWKACTLERNYTANENIKKYFLPFKKESSITEKVIVTVKRIN